MRLLHRKPDGSFGLTEFSWDKVPPYAILSHTWGPDSEEVVFKDIDNGQASHKSGWKKLEFCGEQAAHHDLRYFWVDTCCIDKSSSAELTEAINTMFRWYKEATKCYVYLTDVSTASCDMRNLESETEWKANFRNSRWFTRGWTLQELIAPASVEFFSVEGIWLGNKQSLKAEVHEITGIDVQALQGHDLSGFGVAQKMAWASKRNTTREEDQAYCLLGIFGVHMPLIYGEGKRAFRRLEKEIRESISLGQTPRTQQIDLSCPSSLNPKYTREAFLSSLFFPEHETRRANVKPPWEATFQWIFQDDDSERPKKSKFAEWLQSESSTYWISGKAGSGKSTLMAYILHEYSLKDNLKIWSNGNDVLVLSFFFWRAGSTLQKSVSGILRSLLYQLLEERPGVADFLAAKFRLASGRVPCWTERRLAELLQAALEEVADQYLCLFIDGLDEFQGDTEELLNLIFKLQALKNVKCCLSSRPEGQLVARLSTHEQLRLQDLNFSDIRHFVEERLTANGNTYDSLGSQWIATNIADKAEGVFLWAALVTRSVIEGLQTGDDDDMVRKRIQSTPSGMEDLFMQMLTSIDDFHRDSLSFYLEVMRSENPSRESDGETPSVALITACRNPEDPTDYQEFVKKCHRTETQISAQSKGLLEVVDDNSWLLYRDGEEMDERIVWAIPQHPECSARLSTSESRKGIIKSRLQTPLCPIHQDLLAFEMKTMSFIHRSAYEFIFSPQCEQALGTSTPISSASIQASLVLGRLKLLAAAPTLVDGNSGEVLERRLIVIRKIADYAHLPDKGYAFLTELQDMLPAFSMEELVGVTEETADEVQSMWSQQTALSQQALGPLFFWQACVEKASQVDYVQRHLSDITELDFRGVMLASLCRTCIDVLSEEVKKRVKFSENIVMLLRSMLKNLGQEYQEMTLRLECSNQSLRFGEAEFNLNGSRYYHHYDMSWLHMEPAPETHDDSIVCGMAELYHRWLCLIQGLISTECTNRGQIRLMVENVEEVTNMIKRIIEPWDTHISIRPIQEFHLSANYLFFELSAAVFIQNVSAFEWRYEGFPGPALVYDSEPSLRIICKSRTSPKRWKKTSKVFSVGVVAVHNLRPRVTARLLDFIRLVSRNTLRKNYPPQPFRGSGEEYLEFQELLINDVWENVDQKLDAWQQLYIIACLKTRLQSMWLELP
ncbi:heterokaryon incompatibility protein-domain-containing protein [Cadophora sp. MPI-SDFR-AT-0126]|nr:heterokaryon incompatibility protein-domain-containing protein [Leotiomycetes sp. MPI-SDFR-AT-0126]